MPSFLLAFVAAMLATLAGREAVRVARLSAALGSGLALLAACWLACAAGSGLAAWIGDRLGAQLMPEARAGLAALALLLAAAELAWSRPGRAPVEPTRSFGAIALVLGGAQLASATGLLVLALAALEGPAEPAALGGALGSGAALTAAWRAGREWEARMPLGILRRGVAALLALAALAAMALASGWAG